MATSYKYLINYLKVIEHYNSISKLLNYEIIKASVYKLYWASPLKTLPNFKMKISQLPEHLNSHKISQNSLELLKRNKKIEVKICEMEEGCSIFIEFGESLDEWHVSSSWSPRVDIDVSKHDPHMTCQQVTNPFSRSATLSRWHHHMQPTLLPRHPADISPSFSCCHVVAFQW